MPGTIRSMSNKTPSLWSYYCRVWQKSRELENHGWVTFVLIQVMPTLIALLLLSALFYSATGDDKFATFVEEERTGFILATMGFLVFGLFRMISLFVAAPAYIDAEHQEIIDKKSLEVTRLVGLIDNEKQKQVSSQDKRNGIVEAEKRERQCLNDLVMFCDKLKERLEKKLPRDFRRSMTGTRGDQAKEADVAFISNAKKEIQTEITEVLNKYHDILPALDFGHLEKATNTVEITKQTNLLIKSLEAQIDRLKKPR